MEVVLYNGIGILNGCFESSIGRGILHNISPWSVGLVRGYSVSLTVYCLILMTILIIINPQQPAQ